jgi:hypothetical protein
VDINRLKKRLTLQATKAVEHVCGALGGRSAQHMRAVEPTSVELSKYPGVLEALMAVLPRACAAAWGDDAGQACMEALAHYHADNAKHGKAMVSRVAGPP